MKTLLAGFALLVACVHLDAATYYVRPDGGTPAQCNGLSDAPYTGDANCAWHHPFDALPPQGDGGAPPIGLAGGDTLIIGLGSYDMGADAPGANAYPACNANWPWDCFIAAVPSGTPDQPTRILGQGWDSGCPAAPELWGSEHASRVLSLDGSSNVVVSCLEITDHSACIESHLGGSGPLACNRSTPPYGPWASIGLYARDSSNVHLENLDIHGMANSGVLAGRLHDWSLNHVRIVANGWAGWDGDLGEAAGSSNSGQMLFENLEIGWNGCSENYPDTAIVGCWGQQEGGYGDGLGTNVTSGDWRFVNAYFHHNTQDGLDLLYADTTATISVEQSHAEGNAGNQMKLAGSPTVENSLIVGDCSYFAGVDFMSGTNAAGGSGTGDICRAMGNALVLSVQPGLHARVQDDTILGEGDCLILAINGDQTSSVAIEHNALIGEPAWGKADQNPQPQSCLFYWDSGPSTWPVTYTGNLTYRVKDDFCPPGTGNICDVDPQSMSETLFFTASPLAGDAGNGSAKAAAGVAAIEERANGPTFATKPMLRTPPPRALLAEPPQTR
ncbi:MAG TPA: hypothetical protein VFB32_12305 [Rudaea sp.]|nr:hypothetical protein [Rudaea sp.]